MMADAKRATTLGYAMVVLMTMPRNMLALVLDLRGEVHIWIRLMQEVTRRVR